MVWQANLKAFGNSWNAAFEMRISPDWAVEESFAQRFAESPATITPSVSIAPQCTAALVAH